MSKKLKIRLSISKCNDSVGLFHATYQIVLSRFRVSYHNEHLVIHIFVRDRLTIAVPWCLGDDSVVLNLKSTVLLAHNDHWLSLWIYFFRFCADWDEFNIVFDSQYFATSLSFDVLLRYIFRLIIEQAVWVPRPSNTAHVHLIFWHRRALLRHLLSTHLLQIRVILYYLILDHLHILRQLLCRRAFLHGTVHLLLHMTDVLSFLCCCHPRLYLWGIQ